jgi:hypothetical protein
MKIRFLSLGLVGASFLTGSVFSAKLIEIRFDLNPCLEARMMQSSRPAELSNMPKRIGFGRGTFGENVSGDVTQGKSYVLAATGDLSENPSLANNCVTVNTGSTTRRRTNRWTRAAVVCL